MKTENSTTSSRTHILPLFGLVAIGIYVANETGLLRSLLSELHTPANPSQPSSADSEFDEEYISIVQLLTAQDTEGEDSEEVEPGFVM